LSDTKHRAASLRQLSFLFASAMLHEAQGAWKSSDFATMRGYISKKVEHTKKVGIQH